MGIRDWIVAKPAWVFIVTGILITVASVAPLVYLCEFRSPSGDELSIPVLYIIVFLPLFGIFVGWGIAMIALFKINFARLQKTPAPKVTPPGG